MDIFCKNSFKPLKHLPIGLVGFATREIVLLMTYWNDDSTDLKNVKNQFYWYNSPRFIRVEAR
jgi:hypothetical protein